MQWWCCIVLCKGCNMIAACFNIQLHSRGTGQMAQPQCTQVYRESKLSDLFYFLWVLSGVSSLNRVAPVSHKLRSTDVVVVRIYNACWNDLLEPQACTNNFNIEYKFSNTCRLYTSMCDTAGKRMYTIIPVTFSRGLHRIIDCLSIQFQTHTLKFACIPK